MEWWANLGRGDGVTLVRPPLCLENPVSSLHKALEEPESYPSLSRIFTPSDRVVLAPDRFFCAHPEFLTPILESLRSAMVPYHQVTFLLGDPQDEEILLENLPEEFEEATVTVHDGSDPNKNAMVAVTASGKRLALARILVDADQIIVATQFGLHAHSGWVGGPTQLWPILGEGASRTETSTRFGKDPRPDDSQVVEDQKEACWLIGAPFFVLALPGGVQGVSEFLCGSEAAVEKARQRHLDQWKVSTQESFDRGVGVWSARQKSIEFSELVDTACRLAEAVPPGKEIGLDVGSRLESPATIRELRSGEFLHGERMARIWTKVLARNPIVLGGAGAGETAPMVGAQFRQDLGNPGQAKENVLILENGDWG